MNSRGHWGQPDPMAVQMRMRLSVQNALRMSVQNALRMHVHAIGSLL